MEPLGGTQLQHIMLHPTPKAATKTQSSAFTPSRPQHRTSNPLGTCQHIYTQTDRHAETHNVTHKQTYTNSLTPTCTCAPHLPCSCHLAVLVPLTNPYTQTHSHLHPSPPHTFPAAAAPSAPRGAGAPHECRAGGGRQPGLPHEQEGKHTGAAGHAGCRRAGGHRRGHAGAARGGVCHRVVTWARSEHDLAAIWLWSGGDAGAAWRGRARKGGGRRECMVGPCSAAGRACCFQTLLGGVRWRL